MQLSQGRKDVGSRKILTADFGVPRVLNMALLCETWARIRATGH